MEAVHVNNLLEKEFQYLECTKGWVATNRLGLELGNADE